MNYIDRFVGKKHVNSISASVHICRVQNELTASLLTNLITNKYRETK